MKSGPWWWWECGGDAKCAERHAGALSNRASYGAPGGGAFVQRRFRMGRYLQYRGLIRALEIETGSPNGDPSVERIAHCTTTENPLSRHLFLGAKVLGLDSAFNFAESPFSPFLVTRLFDLI